jgi:hypothetical protein
VRGGVKIKGRGFWRGRAANGAPEACGESNIEPSPLLGWLATVRILARARTDGRHTATRGSSMCRHAQRE